MSPVQKQFTHRTYLISYILNLLILLFKGPMAQLNNDFKYPSQINKLLPLLQQSKHRFAKRCIVCISQIRTTAYRDYHLSSPSDSIHSKIKPLKIHILGMKTHLLPVKGTRKNRIGFQLLVWVHSCLLFLPLFALMFSLSKVPKTISQVNNERTQSFASALTFFQPVVGELRSSLAVFVFRQQVLQKPNQSNNGHKYILMR